jgi:hypothetical protein
VAAIQVMMATQKSDILQAWVMRMNQVCKGYWQQQRQMLLLALQMKKAMLLIRHRLFNAI